MIFDIISLVIVLIFVIAGVKRGGAKVVFGFLSFVVSLILSVFLSHFLAELVYNVFIKQTIINNINSVIADSTIVSAVDKADKLLSTLPVAFGNALGYFGITSESLVPLINGSAVDAIESAIMSTVVGIISVIIFILLFAVIAFLVSKMFKFIARIFRLPVIRVFDSIVGFIFGFAEGILVLLLISFILKIAIPMAGGSLGFINEAYIAESLVFSLFYNGSISVLIQGFIFNFT